MGRFLILLGVGCSLASPLQLRPGECATDLDCWYNGRCYHSSGITLGHCQCDQGWRSADCSVLDLQPAPTLGAFGFAPNVSSWGGVPLRVNGTYHLYVAEMVNSCGLSTWVTNSRIVHSTSDTLAGPYTFKDEAIGVWSHGPSIAVDTSGPAPKYLMWHIGSGSPDNGPVHNCSDSFNPMPSPIEKEVQPHSYVPHSTMLHVADSPDGPWEAVETPGLEDTCKFPLCSMPHAHVFPNGSLYLINQQSWQAYTAPSYKGPYTRTQFVFEGDSGSGGGWEDPFVWWDEHHQVFKMLFHALPSRWQEILHGCSALALRVGAFAYSSDGVHWMRSATPPFTNVVEHIDGNASTYSTRERPKLFFDMDNNPAALFSAVSGNPVPWGCKIKPGVDWTFTQMQPIRSS